ncbi:uncharacterized protein B0P05DRAFT_534144 [Gilbertella persicaria]|uniref:uncharacterized protein n=1 Tax=Gilbertella persicaria TaxID=101096 RepID=UPI0022209B30|nr:uncharacterized protein B0P05DRAFT_534144 [Gilbertella persicaria]KAI8085894.1 hypothetical protein B0P05DRAFT_534144 [Gilbertella persicaria]
MKYVAICKALYEYKAQNHQELSFNTDDILYILENSDPDWYKAQLKTPPEQDVGPIGLVPSNYIEKIHSIGTVKALYDYNAQSVEEVSFKENETLSLYEKDDPDWYVVEKENGDIGLAPSNYIQEQSVPTTTTTAVTAVTATKAPTCDPKWAIALFDFKAESKEETNLVENEQVLITDYVNSTDWWTIQHKDGSSGIVPATYVKFQQDNSDKRVQEAERKRLEEQKRQELEIKRKQDYEIRDRERQRELQEINRQRELEQKERERQAEMDRRRKLQEEAKQKEIEAKRQAAASTNSPQLGSPRRSQIPAPPPPSTHTDPTKPDPAKVRLWTDRTGAFKVEAQLLLCANGKIRLFKTNGVKIDVPTEKMCIEDLRYIEQETGLKLTDDNIPLAQLTRFNWFDYFKRANLPHKACLEYAPVFEANKLTENDVERLTHRQMKMLGMSERHVQRIQRFVETNRAEPPSDDESGVVKPKPKIKKTVTFGTVSYIDDLGYDDDDDEHDRQWQIEQDERLARQLQNQEEKSNHVTLHRRGTGRPTPSHNAPRGVDSTVLTPQIFEPLKPAPVPLQSQQSTREIETIKPVTVPAVPTKQALSTSGFDDDAWVPRTSPSMASNRLQSASAVPQKTSPSSQKSLVDPQLLAKWSGSPALASANARPVPPPPTMLNRNQIPLNQSMPNLHQNPGSILHQQNSSMTSLPSNLQQNNSTASLPNNHFVHSNSMSILPVQHASSFSGYQQQIENANFSPAPQHQQSMINLNGPSNNSFMQSASMPSQLAMSTSLPPPITPQHLQPQMTGASRNWANATPDNPFGGRGGGGGGSSPMLQQQQMAPSPSIQFQQQTVPSPNVPFQPQPQPQQLFSVQPQSTGFVGQSFNQMNSILDANDKYAVFKTIDTSAPSVFNNNNQQQQQQQQQRYYY